MWDILTKYIQEHFAVATVLIVAVLVLIVFVVWWASGVWFRMKHLPCADHQVSLLKQNDAIGKINSTLSVISAQIGQMPCERHEHNIVNHNVILNNINSTLGAVSAQMELLVKLATSDRTAPLIIASNEYSAKKSPRQLNENGLILLHDISGQNFLEENGDKLVEEMEKIAPKTALDVENLALAILRIHSDDDIFIPLKNWVYRAPEREIKKSTGVEMKAVTMDDVYFVLSLPLRDMYLDRHPEILSE